MKLHGHFAGFAVLAGLGASRLCGAQWVTGWDLRIPNPIVNTAVIAWSGTSDAQGNTYLTSVSTSATNDNWTIFKIGPYGTITWQRTFEFNLNSSPTKMVVDSLFDVYAIGGVRTASNVQEVEVVKLSPAGGTLFTKTLTPTAGNLILCNATLDSSNDLFIATTQVQNYVNPELTVTKYSPAFTILGGFTDKNVDPFGENVIFGPNQAVAVAGYSNEISGSQFDILSSAGEVIFSKQFPSFMKNNARVVPQADVYAGPTPGPVAAPAGSVVVNASFSYTEGSSTSYYSDMTGYDMNGNPLWATDVSGATLDNLEAMTPGEFFDFIFHSGGTNTIELGIFNAMGKVEVSWGAAPGTIINAVTGDDILISYYTANGYVFEGYNAKGQLVFKRQGMANGDKDWYGGTCVVESDGVVIAAGTAPSTNQSGITVENNVNPGAGQLSSLTANASTIASGGQVDAIVNLGSAAPTGGRDVNLIATAGTFVNGKNTITALVPAGESSTHAFVDLPAVQKNTVVTIIGEAGGIKRDVVATDTGAKISGAEATSPVTVGNPVPVKLTFKGKMPKGSVIKVTSTSQSTIPNQTITLDEDASEYGTTLDSKGTGSAGTVTLTFTDPSGNTATATVTMSK